MAILNKEGRRGATRKTDRPVLGSVIQIALRPNALFPKNRRKDGTVLIRHPKEKGKKGKNIPTGEQEKERHSAKRLS